MPPWCNFLLLIKTSLIGSASTSTCPISLIPQSYSSYSRLADPADVPQRFSVLVRALTAELNANLQKVLHSLTPIQAAVIRVMAAMGEDYAPFESPTMDMYATAMMQAGIEGKARSIEVPAVQQALIALQEKKLVWKASRGVYAVDEQVIVDLLEEAGLLQGLK